jgi:hypothetical protein
MHIGRVNGLLCLEGAYLGVAGECLEGLPGEVVVFEVLTGNHCESTWKPLFDYLPDDGIFKWICFWQIPE